MAPRPRRTPQCAGDDRRHYESANRRVINLAGTFSRADVPDKPEDDREKSVH